LKTRVYLEVTKRRTFASAIDWPGWCRAGKTEEAALDALVAYGERYAKAIGKRAAALKLPESAGDIEVVERLTGNATTEFGAPGVIPDLDREPIQDAELESLLELAAAAWKAFDRAAAAAGGKTLGPSGPRGGGRSLEKMVEHVAGADAAYVRAIGGSAREGSDWKSVQRAFREACSARAHGELPDVGPRGGERWPARYAIRRSAWHALDHAWEIENRLG
jgi:hypothetical protein